MQPDEFHHARRKFENQANSEKNAYSDEDRADTLPTAALFFMAHLPEKSDLTHRQPLMGEQNRPEKQFKATCVANARMFFALNYIVQHG